MPLSSSPSSVPRRQLPYNQHIQILNIITSWNFPMCSDLDTSYWWWGGWGSDITWPLSLFSMVEKKITANSNGDKKYLSPATHWKKLLSFEICWKKYLGSNENTRPPPPLKVNWSLPYTLNKITVYASQTMVHLDQTQSTLQKFKQNHTITVVQTRCSQTRF